MFLCYDFKYQIELNQIKLTVMSYYRQSPTGYSRRSPQRIERQIIEDQIHLKNVLRSQSEIRRLNQELSLLQIKLRKTEQLEAKCDSLLKQNSLLAHQNDQLARELGERRYELQRLKATTMQLQERDVIKTTQLSEINRSLELQIQLLKKQRLQSNKLYESHIQKLQFMLQDKIKELDLLSIRCNDLINEKEVSEIKFQQQKNRLKNLMNRTNHDMQRQLEYTKQKNTNEKYVEIETLKKNYSNQILLLEDEIGKLKGANDYKSNQFENQLADNKALRNRYEQELKILQAENGSLREKILKLQELNRSQVVNIEVKYKDLQKKDTNDLISGHVQQIKTLIAQIDKLNWLLRDKNLEIQNLIRDKKQQKIQQQERQLAFRAQIDTLKNKLDVQQQKYTTQNQDLNKRINSLADKLLRDSDSYHERVNQFNKNLNDLQSQLKSKQNQIDRARAELNLKEKEYQARLQETSDKLQKTRRDLHDAQQDLKTQRTNFAQFKTKSNEQIRDLLNKNKQLQTERQELNDKLKRSTSQSGDQQKILRLQIQALQKNIKVLQENLSNEQKNHSKEMQTLSSNLKAKLDKFIAQQKQTIASFQESSKNEIDLLNSRLQKSNRDKNQANEKLAQYVKMYNDLQKYFKNPHGGSIAREKGQSNIYEVLTKVNQSTINIF